MKNNNDNLEFVSHGPWFEEPLPFDEDGGRMSYEPEPNFERGDEMIEMDYLQIVRDSIAGERAIDEQTFASAAVLADRLERLKKLGRGFSGIEFSPDAAKLARRKNSIAVC